ncbi:MAG: hypothetical protein WDA27_07805 [Actinomycetota bacterium]
MATLSSLTSETILAEAARLLEDGGYHVLRDAEPLIGVSSDRGLVAEDKYGIVTLVVFGTWADLWREWTDVQGALVSLISDRFTRGEAKAWEGYLVLLTAAPIGPDAVQQANSIRYDTHRVRKLVGTGEDLKTLKDIDRVLLPLMPLGPSELPSSDDGSFLATLPELLAGRGVNRGAADALVQAFRSRQPLMEKLHEYLGEE